MKTLMFDKYTQMSAWAGKQNGVHLLDNDRGLPYIEFEGMFYYFAGAEGGPFYLVMTSSKDIGAEQ